jgi:hypothetical protein
VCGALILFSDGHTEYFSHIPAATVSFRPFYLSEHKRLLLNLLIIVQKRYEK